MTDIDAKPKRRTSRKSSKAEEQQTDAAIAETAAEQPVDETAAATDLFDEESTAGGGQPTAIAEDAASATAAEAPASTAEADTPTTGQVAMPEPQTAEKEDEHEQAIGDDDIDEVEAEDDTTSDDTSEEDDDEIAAEDDLDDEDDEEDVDEDQPATRRGQPVAAGGFTHLDESGRARMVDVGDKPATPRSATAQCIIRMRPETVEMIRGGRAAKGDVLAVAQVAGVMAAKRTPDVIPLCHPLLLTGVDLSLEIVDRLPGVEVTATVRTTGQTGAEMEALTAVSVAALTIYDMCKSADREMIVDRVRLLHKSGGKTGEFQRSDERPRGEPWRRDDRGQREPWRRDDRPQRPGFGDRGRGDQPWRRDDRPQRPGFGDRGRGTWPQHPRRRFEEDEGPGGGDRPPRERHEPRPWERDSRGGPPPDRRWNRDDQRQGFDRGPRRPWRPDDPRDRRGGRYDRE
jgi:cyclic pyranopterin phosphate synthase